MLTDFLRFWAVDVLDRAMFIRTGLLCFIMCFGAGNIYQLIVLIRKGYEAKFIAHLAYADGLTDTGNQMAYIECKSELLSKKAPCHIGIVLCDINNLKYVNDNLGHLIGDKLIKTSADIISDTFGKLGKVFRIGGDEFVVWLQGEDNLKKYEAGSKEFLEKMEQADKEEKSFPVSIAYGFSEGTVSNKEELSVVEKQADANMYKMKSMMKKLK